MDHYKRLVRAFYLDLIDGARLKDVEPMLTQPVTKQALREATEMYAYRMDGRPFPLKEEA